MSRFNFNRDTCHSLEVIKDVPFFERRRHYIDINFVVDHFGKWSFFFAVYQVYVLGVFDGNEAGTETLNFQLFGAITSPPAGFFAFLSFKNFENFEIFWKFFEMFFFLIWVILIFQIALKALFIIRICDTFGTVVVNFPVL